MIAPRTKGRVYVQSLLDAAIAFALFWLCLGVFVLLHPSEPWFYPEFFDRYLVYSVLAFGVIVFQGARSVYSNPRWWAPNLKESHRLSLNQVFNVAVAISLFLVATKDKSISRLFLFSWLPLLYVALFAANRFLPAKIGERFYKGRPERTIFVGSRDSARALNGWREYQQSLGAEFIEYRPDFSISDLAHLDQFIRTHNATQVILTEVPEIKYDLHYVIELCERLGVRLLVCSNFEPLFRHKVTFIEDAGLQFIGLRDEPLESPHNRVIKRAFDLAIAVPVTLVVLPFAASVVWAMHRFQSRGPIFFKQARAGLKGRPFLLYKFRTMHAAAGDESEQATQNDARVFRLGRWLRRTSLDELPQFLNVLRGEMSVVGPRPHLLKHNERFARVMRNYYIRSNVKPGITGLAQVRGFRGETRTDEDVVRRVESDISYLETWSVSLDFVILARTVWQMIFPPRTAV